VHKVLPQTLFRLYIITFKNLTWIHNPPLIFT
jgi:hypothetical protein